MREVVNHLHEFVAVAAHDRRTGEASHFELEAHVARKRIERVFGVAEHVVEIDEIRRRHMRVHLQPAQRQERVDEARHARGLLGHDRQEAVARGRVALGASLQRFDEAAQRSERCPELMTGIGDEIGPHLVDALDLGQVAEQHKDIGSAGLLAPPRQRSDRGRHAAADRDTLGIGDGHGAAEPRCGRDGVEELRGSNHRGNMAALTR